MDLARTVVWIWQGQSYGSGKEILLTAPGHQSYEPGKGNPIDLVRVIL